MREVGEFYDIADVLPLVAALSEKFTSKESSSISYEASQMLLEAVLYTIEECLEEQPDTVGEANERGNELFLESASPSAETLYLKGKDIIRMKAKAASRHHEALMMDFEDYGCLNYRDTVQKGMPEFFLRYDMNFKPQDHLLTLDYPMMIQNHGLCGVDLILLYLKSLCLEKKFLCMFPFSAVKHVLEKTHPMYESLYLGNCCEPVLFTAMLCGITGKSVMALNLNEEDMEDGIRYFNGKSVDKIEAQISHFITQMTNQIPEGKSYFTSCARDFAVRIHLLLKNQL